MTFRNCSLPPFPSMSLRWPFRHLRRAHAADAARRRGRRSRRDAAHLAIQALEPKLALAAVGGLDRLAYGVWDREGGHSVSDYPYTRGQEYAAEWTTVNPGRNIFNWTALDATLQLAYEQNQKTFIKIQPVSSTTVPPWIFSAGVPQIVTPGLTYGYPLDPEYKLYLSEMVVALGKHLREEIPTQLRDTVALVRVDTGATGDEGPYDPPDASYVRARYYITKESTEWRNFRLWLFGQYDQAFQHGNGPTVPLIFQDIEAPEYQKEQDWVRANVTAGFGAKYGGQVRGHHLSESRTVPEAFKSMAVDSSLKFFSVNEMDQTWKKPYFQLNLPLSFYWSAAEQLNAGLGIWDWSGTALEGAAANGFESAATFFNTWAAELDPPTARGGFCIFHEGLDSSDTLKFPETAAYGGNADINNTARYTAISAAYAKQGAQMDDLNAATWGQVLQRSDQNGFNDAGWKIWSGNYERFVTQINPDNTSLGLWRVRGALTPSSHPFDRFARRFDSATGKNAMYFDVNDRLTPTPGQSVELSVTYLDSGTGQFALKYDAVGNSQKTAFTVTKSNSNTWKTQTVVVTDWAFGNSGSNGSDLMLSNVDSENDIFHSIEVVKLGNVIVTTNGQGTVSGRNDTNIYPAISGVFEEGRRLELSVAPANGWAFSGWSGDLNGTNPRPIIFAGTNTRITANFTFAGTYTTTDDFETGTWAGGIGWDGAWNTSGAATPGTTVQLNGGTPAAQITRTLETPIPNATLSFAWDLDRLDAATESGSVQVFDGSWHTVWSGADKGTDTGSTPDLATATIDLSGYGSISAVSFTLNANASTDRFWIDNVSVTGSANGGNVGPAFTADPISKANVVEGSVYTGQTLAGSATDSNGDPLTYSRVSGPAWLSVAANGALSGTPSNSDVGDNRWTVKVSDGKTTATATLNITVTNANDAPVFTDKPISCPNATAGTAYIGQTLSGSATDVDAGALLTYTKVSGPAWLSVASNGDLTGTPTLTDAGANAWTVQVSDGLGGADTAILQIAVAADAAPPTVDFEAVVTPFTAARDTVSMWFSERVTGVSLDDFTLTRGGLIVPLIGVSLEGSGDSYALSGLTLVTGGDGDYRLTLAASGSGITDAAGNLFAIAVATNWTTINSLPGLTTTYGTASPARTFPVSVSRFTADVNGTAPPGFEISGDGIVFGRTATLHPVGEGVTGTFFVRLAASTNAGTHDGLVNLWHIDETRTLASLPISASTVDKKTLTVTAHDASRLLDEVIPALSSTITGFVNGETVAVVNGAAALSTTATGASPVGTYPITAAVGTLAATNYGFSFVAGSLTVGNELVFNVAAAQTQTYSTARSAAVKFIKRGLGTLILDQSSSHSGENVVEAGEMIIRHVSSLGTGAVEVKAGAKVTLDLHDASASIRGLTMAAGGLIDFGFGRFTIASGGYSFSTVLDLLQTGYDDGWTGATGLATRNAQSIAGGGLGYVINDDESLTCGFATSGDTNLDGVVDILDVSSILASGKFDTNESASWSEGDFNYDRMIDILDISEMLESLLFNVGPYAPAPLPQSQPQATTSELSAVEAAFMAFGAGSDGLASTPAKKWRFANR